MVVSIVLSIQSDADPAVTYIENMTNQFINNQGFTVKDSDIMYNYDCWVLCDGRDLHVIIRAKDSFMAKAIAESQYGHCYGVSGPLLD